MDRPLIYAGEQTRSIDFLFGQRAAMIGLAKLAEAILGSETFMSGLGCIPTSPASMSVQVNPGQIFSLENVDSSAYGILAADTAHQIVKQGLLLDATQLACPAPTTSGYSINYLVQVAFQESDTTNVVLPFYNSANPSQPYSGQNNNGTALPTERQDRCIVAVKAGAAATTGSQTTPSPDAGYIGAYVVTVAYGQTTITSTNISAYPGAPFLPADGVFRGLQIGEANYATDTGTADHYAGALSPAPSALTPGMIVSLGAIVASNTGASTFDIGFGPDPIHLPGDSPLQGGEMVAGYSALLQRNDSGTAWNLIYSSGASLFAALNGSASQVFKAAPGAAADEAVVLGQFVDSLVQNGALTLPVDNAGTPGQLIIQRFKTSTPVTAGSSQTFNFPQAFPNGVFLVLPTPIGTAPNANSTSGAQGATTLSTTTILNWGSITCNFNVLAIGW